MSNHEQRIRRTFRPPLSLSLSPSSSTISPATLGTGVVAIDLSLVGSLVSSTTQPACGNQLKALPQPESATRSSYQGSKSLHHRRRSQWRQYSFLLNWKTTLNAPVYALFLSICIKHWTSCSQVQSTSIHSSNWIYLPVCSSPNNHRESSKWVRQPTKE